MEQNSTDFVAHYETLVASLRRLRWGQKAKMAKTVAQVEIHLQALLAAERQFAEAALQTLDNFDPATQAKIRESANIVLTSVAKNEARFLAARDAKRRS
jgi:hypothetical protein